MRKLLCLMMLLIVVSPFPAKAGVVGTQCWIDGKLIGGFPAGYTCPGTGGGSTARGGSPGVDPALYNGFYQLGYQFGQWLFGSGANPQAELQKQQMMMELQRRQAEAERQHQEEVARRLAAMYNRLLATLKLSGLPNLQLKEISNKSSGLQLKIGESANGQAGIKGLPGMYLNDEKKPYGISGLPGIYTGGPGQGSGLSNSGLQLKLGQSSAGPAVSAEPNNAQQSSAASPDGSNAADQALTSESGLQLKSGDSHAQPAVQAAAFDPGKMTPQQLADVAEMVSRLPPEEQQRILAGGQPAAGPTGQPSAQILVPARQLAEASQAAAGAPVLEDASAKARAGFDRPVGHTPVQLEQTDKAPPMLRPPGTADTAHRGPAATLAMVEQPAPSPVANDWIKLYLFPGNTSTGTFPRNPNPPLTNPLREEQKLQAELKAWDDWVIRSASHAYDEPAQESGEVPYPQATERKILNTMTIRQYAPELLDRYDSDIAFRQRVDSGLQQANENVVLDYYQTMANAHKTAILDFQDALEKFAAAGKLDSRIALEEQYRFHPERRQLVQAAWDRISASEQAKLTQALASVSSKLEKEYRIVFRRIRGEAALKH